MPGLYENINKRKKAGTSRPKSKSTVDQKTYEKMGTPAFDKPKPKKKAGELDAAGRAKAKAK
jgi:hypothetical protein